MSSVESHTYEPVHFMVDLETLDVQPSSVILSIGACIIPQAMDPSDTDTFYIEVRHEAQFLRTKSLDTMRWWETQSNCPDKGTALLSEALGELRQYFRKHTDNPIIWCKGLDFDVSILTHAYKQYGIPLPWKYNDVRDFRTVKKLFWHTIMSAVPENPQAHHALCDAVHQARQLKAIGLELI